MENKLLEIISQGEGLHVEFKKSQGGLPKNIYETVCAFSNTGGGCLLLGVSDSGEILGIDKSEIDEYKTEFVIAVNNSNKMNPPLYLVAEECVVDGKNILFVEVPETSDVLRCNGRIYVRNADGDVDITNNQRLVSELYIKKQKTYTENEIIKAVTIKDLRTDLIAEARKRAVLRNPDHAWGRLDDMELLRSLLNYPSTEEQQKEGCSQSLLVIPAAGLGGYFLCHFWPSGCILALCLPVLMKKESKKVTKI